MALTDTILSVGQNPSYKGVLGAAGTATQALGSLTKKIRSLNGDEMNPGTIRDYYTNGFLAQDSVFKPSFFARMFDEPTYLTFKVEFMFNDPVTESRNTAYNNNGLVNTTLGNDYYSIMYDFMPEPFLDDYFMVGPNTDASMGKRYSTETYLDLNLGDHGRAQMLHNFKMALKDIEKNFPYYFTSIGGIDKLVAVEPANGARLKDCTIELDCLEGLDLKITQLLQLYRKIVWDDVYQRWVLPDMMRYFGMRIYISEMRLFSTTKKEKDKGPKVYDFGETESRNMTYSGKKGKSWMDKTKDIVGKGTAVSQKFLGTKSVITQALDYTSATMTTLDEGYRDIAGAFNQVQYCNNAINEVMPTICFECHMCEFDITDTLSYMGTLSSHRGGSEEVKPKIKIKIGQVKESQAYPLNVSLTGSDANGYLKTIKSQMQAHNIPVNPSIQDYNEIPTLRGRYNDVTKEYEPGNLTFAGGFISDKMLSRRYASENLGERIGQQMMFMASEFGFTKAQTISEKRFSSPKIIDDAKKMQYRPDDLPQAAAASGLFAAGMNEAVSIASHLGVGSNIIGTRSLATDQTSSVRQSLEAVGDAMMAALDRIYNGEEMKSMAVHGVPDSVRANLADGAFNAFLTNLETSYATQNPVMENFIRNYRKIEGTEYISKATNTKFSNLN